MSDPGYLRVDKEYRTKSFLPHKKKPRVVTRRKSITKDIQKDDTVKQHLFSIEETFYVNKMFYHMKIKI